MKLYFGGAEVPGWRKMLADERVPAVSLSFVGLTRRIKNLDAWLLADKFAADPGFRQEIMLDSGAYSLNKDGAGFSDEEALELYRQYMAFVRANLDRIDVFSEFDALQLGGAGRALHRNELHELAPDKFMPIWHSSDGMAELDRLAERYQRVGILQPAADIVSDMAPVLRSLVSRHDVRLHGVAMTRMAAMQNLPWDSVGSTSWLSPGQYGDTFVWVGGELKRYPVKYKEQSRKRHRTLFADQGFDPLAIARDAKPEGTSEDRKEVLRLSLWSWNQFVEDINRRQDGEVVTQPAEPRDGDFEENDQGVVDKPRGRSRNAELVPTAREKTLLPVLSVSQEPANDSGNGTETEARVGLSTGNLMRCNTCFAKDKCPAFQPDAECAYEIPMVIKTSTQARALRKLLLGVQGQRVLTMRMFEQLEGGYADPNLSAEMMRLQKMLNDDIAADREHASIEIRVNTDGNAGMISRIFGGTTEEKVNALAEPVDPSKMIESSGIFDAEIVEDGNAG